MNESAGTRHWGVCKYSRFKPDKSIKAPGVTAKPGCNGDWIAQEATPPDMMQLSLTRDGHMLITSGDTILESLFLPSGTANYRSSKVFQKNDSLLFLYKINVESRMFRVQFQKKSNESAENLCKNCARALSDYFAVRSPNEGDIQITHNDKNEEPAVKNDPPETEEDPTIAMMASALMKFDLNNLPLIYRDCKFKDDSNSTEDSDEYLERFLSLCLTDPNFPTFVGKIETILNKFTSEGGKCISQ